MQKIPALDGLRGLAALAVLLFHAGSPYARGGSLGVDVFFVLSGYLITSVAARELEARGGIDLRRFFARRARRLVPALAALIVVYLVAAPLLAPRYADRRWLDAGLAALYLTNFAEAFAKRSGPLSHTWSLAVEAQFYLLWPLVLLRLRRLGRGVASLVALAAWALLTLLRIVWMRDGGGADLAYYVLHAEGLLLGAAVALNPLRPRGGPIVGYAALAALAGLAAFGGRLGFQFEIPLAEVAAALLVRHPPKALAWPPLTGLGAISYGVYLWHVPLNHALHAPGPLALSLASIAAATVSYFAVERWFLDRRRSGARRAAARGAVAEAGAA